MSEADYTAFMREALAEAELSRWQTYPNPAVGAVLVRDGTIVARGRHRKAGLPHAEVECLRDAREKGVEPKDCTLVVTLEPCRHYGRTPPCTKAILDAGIRRLVFGLRDPTENAGGGAEILRDRGVHVVGPVLEEECRDMIADFIAWKTRGSPYVILKMAATLDGRIATRTGHSKWISSETSRETVHRLRAFVGAAKGVILVGGNTFRTDNPRLTARVPGESVKNPRAAILTSRLPEPGSDFFLLNERPDETVFFSGPEAASSKEADALRKRGVRVLPTELLPDGTCDLDALFRTIFTELESPYVLCEGGGILGLRLLSSRLVDEFHLHLAPILLADNNALPLFSGLSPLTISDALSLRFAKAELAGADVHLLLRPRQNNEV